MRAIKKSKNKKPFIIIAIVIAVLLIGAGIWYLIQRHNAISGTAGTKPVNTVDYGPPTEQEKQENAQQKDEIIKNAVNPPPTDQSLAISISRVFQDTSGFNIRTIVTGTSDGECVITLSKSGQTTITKTFPVTVSGTYNTCDATPVPTSEFPASGTWNVSALAQKDNKKSATATTTIGITK